MMSDEWKRLRAFPVPPKSAVENFSTACLFSRFPFVVFVTLMKTTKPFPFAPLAAVALALAAPIASAQEAPAMPEMPQPREQHRWLEKLAGDWESDVKIFTQPDEAPVESKSTESAAMLGGFWLISKGEGDMMGAPFKSVLTIGYDADKEKFVGSWIDTAMGKLWIYEGTLDEAETTLTLESEGHCPMRGETAKFRDVVELKSPDHKVVTSMTQTPDGEWITLVVVDSRKKN